MVYASSLIVIQYYVVILRNVLILRRVLIEIFVSKLQRVMHLEKLGRKDKCEGVRGVKFEKVET